MTALDLRRTRRDEHDGGGRRRRGQQGVAALELALVLPMLLGLIGLALFAAWLGVAQAVLEHGAAEGARAASTPSAADLRSWPTAAEIAGAVDAATPLISPSTVDITGDASGGAPVRVVVTATQPNPVAVLLAPLRVLGLPALPSSITLRAVADGRRE